MTRPSSDAARPPELGSWEAPDGTELAVRRWSCDRPRAHVGLIHGYAEHSGRYARVGARLAARGFAVEAVDLRGHGNSPGVRGDVVAGERWVEDARAFVFGLPRPRFAFGHSVGGAVVALAVAGRADLDGLILSSPYLVNAVPVPGWLERAGAACARALPLLPLARLDAEGVSRDPEEVRAYREDPLVYTGRIRARAGTAMLQLGAAALAAAPEVRVDTLILHGSADRIADPAGARAFVERMPDGRGRLALYPGGYHELLNDLDRDRVVADVLAWLEARTREPPQAGRA